MILIFKCAKVQKNVLFALLNFRINTLGSDFVHFLHFDMLFYCFFMKKRRLSMRSFHHGTHWPLSCI